MWVCGCRWCKERGGEATLSSFVALAPLRKRAPGQGAGPGRAPGTPIVSVHEVDRFGVCDDGPNIRVTNGTNLIEVNRVDSIEKVVSTFTSLLGVAVEPKAVECLKLNLEAICRRTQAEVCHCLPTPTK